MAITVARTVAELRGISVDDVLAACYQNTRIMYGIWSAAAVAEQRTVCCHVASTVYCVIFFRLVVLFNVSCWRVPCRITLVLVGAVEFCQCDTAVSIISYSSVQPAVACMYLAVLWRLLIFVVVLLKQKMVLANSLPSYIEFTQLLHWENKCTVCT